MSVMQKVRMQVGVAVALLAAPWFCVAAGAAALDEAMTQARELLQPGVAEAPQKARRARRLLDEAVKASAAHPKINEAKLLLGEACHKDGSFRRAVEVLSVLREEKPEGVPQAEVLLWLARALNGAGDYFRAAELARVLMDTEEFRDDPRRPEMLFETAWHYENVLRRMPEAVDAYRKLAVEHPQYGKSPLAAVRAGHLLEHEIKELREAVDAYMAAARSYPTYEGDPLLHEDCAGGWGAGWRAHRIAGQITVGGKQYGLVDFGLKKQICEELARLYPAKRDVLYIDMMRTVPNAEERVEWAQKTLQATPNNTDALQFLADWGPEEQRRTHLMRYLKAGGTDRRYADRLTSTAETGEAVNARPADAHLLFKGIDYALAANRNRVSVHNRRREIARLRAEADALNKQAEQHEAEQTRREGRAPQADDAAKAAEEAGAKALADAKVLRETAARLREEAVGPANEADQLAEQGKRKLEEAAREEAAGKALQAPPENQEQPPAGQPEARAEEQDEAQKHLEAAAKLREEAAALQQQAAETDALAKAKLAEAEKNEAEANRQDELSKAQQDAARKLREDAAALREQSEAEKAAAAASRQEANGKLQQAQQHENAIPAELARAQTLDPRPQERQEITNDFAVARGYLDRLNALTNRTEAEQVLVERANHEFARDTASPEMLQALAYGAPADRTIGAAAGRDALRLLIAHGNTTGAFTDMRRYLVTYSDYHRVADSSHNEFAEICIGLRDLYGGNRQAAHEAFRKLEQDVAIHPAWAGRELLRQQLGVLAYRSGRRDEAAEYFSRRTANDDLGARCWKAHFDLAIEVGDLETLLELGNTPHPKHAQLVTDVLRPAVQRLLEEGEYEADERAYFEARAAQMSGAAAAEIGTLYDAFLAAFPQSRFLARALLNRAGLLRATLQKGEDIAGLADSLVAAAPKVQNVSERIEVLRAAGEYYGQSGASPAGPVLVHWSVVGPFDAAEGGGLDRALPPEQKVDLAAAYPAMGEPKEGEEPPTIKWNAVEATTGYVDLGKSMNPNANVVAYAATYVSSPVEQEVLLYASTQKPMKVLLNGAALITVAEARGHEWDFYLARAKLAKGTNELLVKSVQSEKDWGFAIRLCRLTSDAVCAAAPQGATKEQTLTAAVPIELRMWSAFESAAALAGDERRNELLVRPFEILWGWGRGTEACGGYRSLLETDPRGARLRLLNCYGNWGDANHRKTFPHASQLGWEEQAAIYVRDFEPENPDLVSTFCLYADRQPYADAARELAAAYLKKYPGNWPLLDRLWEWSRHLIPAAGQAHALEAAQAYPARLYLLDKALAYYRVPELAQLRYERTKDNKDLLLWSDALYRATGLTHRSDSQRQEAASKSGEAAAAQDEQNAARQTELAGLKERQAAASDEAAKKAEEQGNKELAEQQRKEAEKLRAEADEHRGIAREHTAKVATLRQEAQTLAAESRANMAAFEKLRARWVDHYARALRRQLAGVTPEVAWLRQMMDVDREAADAVLGAVEGRDFVGDFNQWRDVGDQYEKSQTWALAAKAFRNAAYHPWGNQNEYIDIYFRWAASQARSDRPEGAVRPLELVLSRFGSVEARGSAAEQMLCTVYRQSMADRPAYVAEVRRFLWRYPGSDAAGQELERLRALIAEEGEIRSLLEDIAAQLKTTRDPAGRRSLTLTMANLLYGAGRYDEALRMLASYPRDDTGAALLRAYCAWRTLDYSGAMEQLAHARGGQAYGKEPAATPTLEFFLAMVRNRAAEEDYIQAFELLDEAVRAHGDLLSHDQKTQIMIARVDALIAQGSMDTALPLIQQIQAENPRRSAYWVGEVELGKIQHFANRHAEALNHFRKAAGLLDPEASPRALFWIGKTQLAMDQMDEAIETFKELWERYGDNELVIQAIYLIGQTYHRKGEFMDAIRLFESVGVMRAMSKEKVVPGEDVVLRVIDPDYAVGTGRNYMEIDIETTSGDTEKVRIDANPINRSLFVGSIKSKLASPKPNSGMLELRGSDVVTIRYLDKFGRMSIRYRGAELELDRTKIQVSGGTNLSADIGTQPFGAGYVQYVERVVDEGLESYVQGYLDGGGHLRWHVGVRFLRPRLVERIRLYTAGYEPYHFEIQVLKPDGDESKDEDWIVRKEVDKFAGKGWTEFPIVPSETLAVRVFVPDHPSGRGWRRISELQVMEGSAAMAWSEAEVKVTPAQEKVFRLYVVDDGAVEISSTGFDEPEEEQEAPEFLILGEEEEEDEEERSALEIEIARRRPGRITPGNTVFVRLTDKDLDVSDEADKFVMKAYTVGTAGRGERVRMDSCLVELVEIDPHVGELRGVVRTAPSAPTATASDSAAGHPPDLAIDGRPRADSAWQAEIDGLPGKWVEVDLKQVHMISEVGWERGEGADDRVIHDGSISLYGAEEFKEISFEGVQDAHQNLVRIEPPVAARYVRLTANAYDSDAPAVAQIVIKDDQGNVLAPVEVTPEQMRNNDVLEFNVGDSMQVEYLDEENITPGEPTRRLSNSLSVLYDSAAVSMAITKLDRFGRVEEARLAARINAGDLFQVLVQDADEDRDDDVQKVMVHVECESGDSMDVEAAETDGASATFAADIMTSSKPEAMKDRLRLYVREGDAIWATYVDEKNMSPGHRVTRGAVILEATPTSARVLHRGQHLVPVPDFARAALSAKRAARPELGVSLLDPDVATSPFKRIPLFVGGRNTGQRLIAGASAVDLAGTLDTAVPLTKDFDPEPLWEPRDLSFDRLLFDVAEVRQFVEKVRAAGEEEREELRAGPPLTVLGDDVVFLQYVDRVGARSGSELVSVLARGEMQETLTSSRTQGEGVPAPDSEEFLARAPVVRLTDPETLIEQEEAERAESYARLMGRRRALYREMLDFLIRQRDDLAGSLEQAVTEAQTRAGEQGAQEREETQEKAPGDMPFEVGEEMAAVDVSVELTAEDVLTTVEVLRERLRNVEADIEAAEKTLESYMEFDLPTVQEAEPTPAERAEDDGLDEEERAPYFPAPAPGYPFKVWVIDRDLAEQQTCRVTLRSFSHRLLGRLEAEARRTQVEDPASGDMIEVFEATVPTGLEGGQGILPVTWGGRIHIAYEDPVQPLPLNRLRRSFVAFASDGSVAITGKNYVDPPRTLRVGETVYVQVTDPDRDVSYEPDSVLVNVSSSADDSVLLLLSETADRSGEFHGRIQTGVGEVNPNDPILQCTYGGQVTVQYVDHINLGGDRPAPGGPPATGRDEETEEPCVELSVRRDERGIRTAVATASLVPGSDGEIKLFARALKRGRLEKETLFSLGYCHYMLGTSFTKLGAERRAEMAFARAREEFGRLIRAYPGHKQVAHATFYLGNVEFVRGNYPQAINHYRSVIDQWRESEFVPEVRLRMGLAYENLGKTEEAIDQYAYLAFHHKDSPYVGDAMINMVQHFDKMGAKAEQEGDEEARDQAFDRLVSVARRFSEKFPTDQRTPKLILRAGLRLVSLRRYAEAAELFEEAEKKHAESPYVPAFLYWHAEAVLQGNIGREPTERAIVMLKRVVYDFDNERYTRAAKVRLETLER